MNPKLCIEFQILHLTNEHMHGAIAASAIMTPEQLVRILSMTRLKIKLPSTSEEHFHEIFSLTSL